MVLRPGQDSCLVVAPLAEAQLAVPLAQLRHRSWPKWFWPMRIQPNWWLPAANCRAGQGADAHTSLHAVWRQVVARDTLAERLRRRPAKPMGSPRVGANPTGVVLPKCGEYCAGEQDVSRARCFVLSGPLLLLLPLLRVHVLCGGALRTRKCFEIAAFFLRRRSGIVPL